MTAKLSEGGATLAAIAAALARAGPSQSHVDIGGRVVESAQGFFRIAGVGAHVCLGDRLFDRASSRPRGEIVHIDRRGAIATPFDSKISAAIGEPMYRMPSAALFPRVEWRGRVVNALGEPVDGAGPLPYGATPAPLMRAPPPALEREPLGEHFRTGVRAIDAFAPLCVGQRIGVFAGSGVGKSTLLAMLANAPGFDDLVIGLVGERGREVRDFLEGPLAGRRSDAIVVVATSDESAVMRRLAARASLSVAEWLRDNGRRVLLIMDSVTRFAQASREIAIAAGEPSVSRGFPPSVFSDLPALLERAGPGVADSGSITAIFSVLVDGDDHNDPIADAIRGILDGHIVLTRDIANRGHYPAIDILASISRLSGRIWTPEKAKLVSTLRRMASRFENTRDLRAMGGYTPGLDADLDAAVALAPRLYAALTQRPDDRADDDPFGHIARALKDGASETTGDARQPPSASQGPVDGR